MKILSFALWGDVPTYTIGAVRNAELAATVYPSWTCRFYCAATVPSAIVARLERQGHVEIVRMPDPGDWRAMFWRFLPASEVDVEIMLSRDTDSRLGGRERAAVDAWLASDRDFHVMRDHPMHGVPILGGMWGVRGGLLRDMHELIAAYQPHSCYKVDQHFLERVVVPRVRDRWLEHDAYFTGRPFPTRRVGRTFVGQPFDEHDRPLVEGPDALEEWVAWMRNRRVGVPRLVRHVRRSTRRARSRVRRTVARLAPVRAAARPIPLPERPRRVLVLQSDGEHKGQDGWTPNWYLRECWALADAFRRNGVEADVWGPGHETWGSPPDFDSYDLLFCAENTDLSWIPRLGAVRGPCKVQWIVDLHAQPAAVYERVSWDCDVVLHATRSLMSDYARLVPHPAHRWFPNAVDDRWFDAVRWRRPKTRDVVFVGTRRVERAHVLARLERDVGLECVFATGEDMLATVAAARICVDAPIGPDLPYRIFETIGLGSCLVAAANPELEDLGFVDDVNCLLYGDVDDAVAKIRAALAGGSWERIGAAGHALAKRHSYAKRIGGLLRTLTGDGDTAHERVGA